MPHTEKSADVIVRDLFAGVTVRASVDTGGGDPENASLIPSISANGTYVAFESFASDLVPDDGNGAGTSSSARWPE